MAGRGSGFGWSVAGTGVMGLILGIGLAGCGHSEDKPKGAAEPGKGQANPGEANPTAVATSHLDPALHQSFAEATTQDVPPSVEPPVDMTIANKPTGKLFKEVQRIWDDIKFQDPGTGKMVNYTAVLDTDQGSMELALLAEHAPNHVRNFVALARVGYYDGLVFERTVRVQDEETGDRVDWIEGGCPQGTGDDRYGHIGYWMKPELVKTVTHEEGSVGAYHGPELAACKFYITLSKAPTMDGEFTVFGKITRGLETAHAIFAQPVRPKGDPEYPDGDRPQKPVVIRKVTIQTSEGGKPGPEFAE